MQRASLQLAAFLLSLLANLVANQLVQATASETSARSAGWRAPLFLFNTPSRSVDLPAISDRSKGSGQLLRSVLEARAQLGPRARQLANAQFQRHLDELVMEAIDETNRKEQQRQREQEARAQQQELTSVEELIGRALKEIEPMIQDQRIKESTSTSSNVNSVNQLQQPEKKQQQQHHQVQWVKKGQHEWSTEELMLRELERLPTLAQRNGALMNPNERSRRVSGSKPSQSQHSLMLTNQQLDSIESLNSLLDTDYARVYKPKNLSVARGFGKR